MTADQSSPEEPRAFRPLLPGFERQWVRCNECQRVAFYDYQPYSLSNPIKTLPCGHGAAQRWEHATTAISPEEAAEAIRMQRATQDSVVTVDDQQTVLSISRPPGASRWRFQRVRAWSVPPTPELEERHQEICAAYVDERNTTVQSLIERFGLTHGGLASILSGYGIPPRNQNLSDAAKRGKRSKDDRTESGDRPAVELDTRTRWRVTVVRTITEVIYGDDLVDIAAHYDGQDARIERVERA